MSLVRPVVKDDAKAFGAYPSSDAAVSTLLRIFSETEAPSVNVRETADVDTPARLATSFRVTGIGSLVPYDRSAGIVEPNIHWGSTMEKSRRLCNRMQKGDILASAMV